MKLISPVFTKEMITLSRRKRHYVARALLLGLLLFIVWTTWRENIRHIRYGYVDLSTVGYRLFTTFAITQLIAVLFLIPALTSPVVAAEKDRDTLGLLLMSNLNRRNILLDKLLSRMALISLLLLSGLPLFLALLAFGGVSPEQIVVSYVAMFGWMFFCGALGLLCSTLANRMHTALISTYALLALYIIALIVVAESNPWPMRKIIWHYFLPFNLADLGLVEVAGFLVYTLVFFLLSLSLSVYLLPRVAQRAKRHILKRIFSGLNRFFRKINVGGVVVMRESRPPGRNAALWWAMEKSFFSSNIFIIRAFALTIMITLAVCIVIPFVGSSDFAPAVLIFLWVLLGVVATVASAAAFTTEKEKHRFDVLLTTPINARSLVMAKFLGVLKGLLPFAFTLLLWGAVAYFPLATKQMPGVLRYLWHAALIMVTYVPFMVVIGLHASALRRRTSTAVLQAFIIVLVWSLAPVILLALNELTRILPWRRMANDILEFMFSLSPLTAVMLETFAPSELHCLACAALIPFWIVALFSLANRFDRIMGRQ